MMPINTQLINSKKPASKNKNDDKMLTLTLEKQPSGSINESIKDGKKEEKHQPIKDFNANTDRDNLEHKETP